MGIENISKSRWSQIENLEAAERGETTKGREIVRVVPNNSNDMGTEGDEGGGSGSGPGRGGGGGGGAGMLNGMSKLRVQDAKGTNVFAMELRSVNGVRVGMGIGCKVRYLFVILILLSLFDLPIRGR